MKKMFLLLSIVFYCLCVQAQSDSVFWFVAPEVCQGTSSTSFYDRPIKINFASFNNYPINVTISQPANSAFSPIVNTIPANGALTINLTPWIDIIENKPADAILPYGLLIQTSGLVNANYEVNMGETNPEIYSLKGKNALGTHFMIPGQTEYFNASHTSYNPNPLNRIDIVATEDNTVVTITPSKGIVGHAANVSFTKNLNSGETYSCVALGRMSTQHLEGTVITSNQPIAVTITDDLLTHPDGEADLIGDQIVPIDLIGQEYIAIKGELLQDIDKVYVLATENNTSIYLDGNTTPVATISKGQTHILTFSAGNNAMYITSDKPVYAFQLTGMGTEFGGTILPQIECTGSKQIKYKRATQKTLKFNLCVPVSGISSFSFNGNSSIIRASDFSPVPGTNNQWYYAIKNISLTTIAQNSLALISNPIYFHLGVLEGDQTLGTSYAFFSDYAVQYTTDIFDTTCPNIAYTKNGFDIPADSLQIVGTFEFRDTIPSTTNGCNTIIILNLNVKDKDTTEIDAKICEGETYQENGFNCSVAGTYTQELKNHFGCDSVVILYLSVAKLPDTVFIHAAICEGETYTKNGFTASETGTYTKIQPNDAGCDSVVALELTVNPIPDIEIIAVTDRFCEDNFMELEVKTNGDKILWNTGRSENPITITMSGIYTATTYLGDCKDTASYTVGQCPCYVWLPNAFTPNSDGLNEIFKPYISCYETMKNYKFFIYDRWGNRVFQSFDYAIGWDGTDGKGKVYANGSYNCILEYTDPQNKHITKKGAVTVIK